MKTEVYNFDKINMDYDKIIDIAGQAADDNSLTNKQKLRLTLLTEELAKMLPNLLDYGSGEFWIENDDRNFEIHANVNLDSYLPENEMKRVLSVSRTGNNAAAVGIFNKLRIAAETMLANYSRNSEAGVVHDTKFYEMGVHSGSSNYMYHWSMSQLRKSAQENNQEWDKLEKSIIANFADDVIVGIIKGKADITIKKWFDKE